LIRNAWTLRILTAATLGMIGSGLLLAQEAQQQAQSGQRQTWWDTDYMLNWYVKGLTRQYNLTPTQEEFTRKLLTKRVKDFLKTNETEMRRMMWEMADYQAKRQIPTPDTVKEWAETGGPIFKEARKAIMDGNMEWREILDDEQKKRHDQDLRGLEDYFKKMEERMDRWSKGDVEERDMMPYGAANQNRVSQEPWSHAKPEDAWEIYFRGFSRRYNLNDAQKETGMSILRECRARAEKYRDNHKADFEAIEAKIVEIRQKRTEEGADKEKLASVAKELDQLRARKFDLEKPIYNEIGKEFRDRLEGIPTTEQKEAYKQKQQKLLDSTQQRQVARKATIEGRPTTQPAESQAAETQPAN